MTGSSSAAVAPGQLGDLLAVDEHIDPLESSLFRILTGGGLVVRIHGMAAANHEHDGGDAEHNRKYAKGSCTPEQL